jgi:hypothetical protein
VFIATGVTDMRKSINGLLHEGTKEQMEVWISAGNPTCRTGKNHLVRQKISLKQTGIFNRKLFTFLRSH